MNIGQSHTKKNRERTTTDTSKLVIFMPSSACELVAGFRQFFSNEKEGNEIVFFYKALNFFLGSYGWEDVTLSSLMLCKNTFHFPPLIFF